MAKNSLSSLLDEVIHKQRHGRNHLYLGQKDQFDKIPREYVKGFIRDTENRFDTHYLTYEPVLGKFHYGNSEMDFKGNDIFIKDKNKKVEDRIYKGTYGLYEFLFKNKPNESLMTPEDLNNYRNIILSTNAQKRNFDANAQKAGNRVPQTKQRQQRLGKELQMQYTNKLKEYVYWDDCNKLVERLRLIISSQYAGNNSHANEIKSIIEELKEE
ncbi:unnamed protein product [Brassicogethes aeneus]|uniref:DUF8207 domain-containing protein n=1 Tax=Brassicogethes aeneus TaxID=1431903 RepID=A0A9P0FIM2_BRAAE|nr:unnamed protein product [Brassicogethes aeneus]